MIQRYAILALALLVSGVFTARAARYETVSTGTYSFTDPAAWVGGRVPPNEIRNRDTVIIRTEVVLMTSLVLKPGAVLEVTDILIVYNPNGGAVLDNKGHIQVEGMLRILPGLNGQSNTLVHQRGLFTVNGTLENVGGDLTNRGEISINMDGAFRNFGYSDADDNNLIRSAGSEYYNLYVFGSNLFGYSLDPGSLIGGTGGPSDGGIPDPDSIDYSILDWVCLAGLLENTGTITVRGGFYDTGDCGGGIVSGSGDIILGECSAPDNLRVTGSNHDSGLTFRWDAVDGVHSYMCGFRPAGAAHYRVVRSVAGGSTSLSFPRNFFPAGARIDWAVLTVCSPGEIDLDNLSSGGMVDARMATSVLDAVPVISVYPNPVSDLLSLESSAAGLSGQMQILDINGRLMLEQPINISPSSPVWQLSLRDLDAGLYVLRINDGVRVHQESLMVSR